jgi:hypothetical protein
VLLLLLLLLLLQVVVPRPGSPLCFSAIEHFAVATFKDMAAYERSADVRQVRQKPKPNGVVTRAMHAFQGHVLLTASVDGDR